MHSIAAGVITEVFGFPITNTMLGALITTLTLTILAIAIRSKLSQRPGKLQTMFELIYDYIKDLCVTIADEHRAEKFLPWILSFFLFILVSNYWGLVPIFGEGISVKEYVAEDHVEETKEEDHSEGLVQKVYAREETINEVEHEEVVDTHEENSIVEEKEEVEHEETAETAETEHEEVHHVPLFRAATSDTNTTFALSVVSFFLIVGFGLFTHNPIGLLKHYMQFSSLETMEGFVMKMLMLPIFLFVGILEIILEPLKSISLAFRLFGNIYAGETLVASMTVLNGAIVPLVATPFLLLEVLVGAIQALVFSLLTLVFLSILTSKHH